MYLLTSDEQRRALRGKCSVAAAAAYRFIQHVSDGNVVVSGSSVERRVEPPSSVGNRTAPGNANKFLIKDTMDRMGRNLDDLRKILLGLTERGVRVEFVKESLTFTGQDSAMSKLLLSVMGAFAEFERELIRERQREGIALAKRAGVYKGRKRSLPVDKAAELRQRAAAGEQKAALAREFGVDRATVYRYLKRAQR
ncbi:recombinase family protein [Acidisarcina polymorpha]|nr:recombinase family protein [Acidisarcina polymorpha]